MTKPPLPLSIQTFSEMRTGGYCYVDKTAAAHALVQKGKAYFLSRPRRFGKSLFVDTLKELFEGNEALFRGLHIHPHWDWSQRHPVMVLDFAAGVVQNRMELDQRILDVLRTNRERLGLEDDTVARDIPGLFSALIRQTHAHSGQRVVVLIDEYDKPILDNIEHTERAAEIREGLKNLYSVLKAEDAHLRFVFMTGVSKFSKVSLFSGINQLHDITLNPEFATLCGYTQQDLETTFAAHLEGVDWDELRHWYNGYGFLGESVYNPYDILLFIREGHRYRNYWFQTGSPSFLIKLFQQRRYFLPDLEQLEVGEEILDSFDVERINAVTLLFQSGYLTIAATQQRRGRLFFALKVPNHEVRLALNDRFIGGYTNLEETRFRLQDGLYDSLTQGDLPGLIATIERLFASIPWRNFTNNTLPEAEGYYASVLYAFFASLDAEILPEDISNHGQVDLTIKLAGFVYVIEIKLIHTEQPPADNPALAQIQARAYSAKYRHTPNQGLFEVGLVFSSTARNLIQADWRRLD